MEEYLLSNFGIVDTIGNRVTKVKQDNHIIVNSINWSIYYVGDNYSQVKSSTVIVLYSFKSISRW